MCWNEASQKVPLCMDTGLMRGSPAHCVNAVWLVLRTHSSCMCDGNQKAPRKHVVHTTRACIGYAQNYPRLAVVLTHGCLASYPSQTTIRFLGSVSAPGS